MEANERTIEGRNAVLEALRAGRGREKAPGDQDQLCG